MVNVPKDAAAAIEVPTVFVKVPQMSTTVTEHFAASPGSTFKLWSEQTASAVFM